MTIPVTEESMMRELRATGRLSELGHRRISSTVYDELRAKVFRRVLIDQETNGMNISIDTVAYMLLRLIWDTCDCHRLATPWDVHDIVSCGVDKGELYTSMIGCAKHDHMLHPEEECTKTQVYTFIGKQPSIGDIVLRLLSMMLKSRYACVHKENKLSTRALAVIFPYAEDGLPPSVEFDLTIELARNPKLATQKEAIARAFKLVCDDIRCA